MAKAIVKEWNTQDAFLAAKKTADLLAVSSPTELRGALDAFLMEDAKCAVFVSALPEHMRLTKLVDSAFIRLAISVGSPKTLAAMAAKALRDIMFTFIDATITVDELTLSRAYASIYTTLHLGLLSLDRVLRNVTKYVMRQQTGDALHAMYALFGEVCMYKGSVVDSALRSHFRASHRDDLIEGMSMCKSALLKASLTYATLDLSPRQGSMWLRSLVLKGELDREEAQAGLTQNSAFVSRWFRYARSKTDTKRNIMLEVIDGMTLIEFALEATIGSPPGGVNPNMSYLGHLLLFNCVYTVSVEHPTMLSDTQYASLIQACHNAILFHAHRGLVSGLEARVPAILDKPSPAFADLKDLANRGLCWNRIMNCLIDCPLREQNVVVWRALLKQCLATMREQNVSLEITF